MEYKVSYFISIWNVKLKESSKIQFIFILAIFFNLNKLVSTGYIVPNEK